MLQEDHAVLWKLKLSLGHAITAWSVWKRDAIYKAIQEATQAELLFIAELVNVRFEEQRSMLNELFNVAGKTITRHKGFETQMVRVMLSTNSLSATQQEATQTLSVRILKILVATTNFCRLSKISTSTSNGHFFGNSTTKCSTARTFCRRKSLIFGRSRIQDLSNTWGQKLFSDLSKTT
jgi:hypothetical protein